MISYVVDFVNLPVINKQVVLLANELKTLLKNFSPGNERKSRLLLTR